jgi:hypothetical protein
VVFLVLPYVVAALNDRFRSCSMALSTYDEIFLGVLKEKGHIMPFLDAVFGFLYNW